MPITKVVAPIEDIRQCESFVLSLATQADMPPALARVIPSIQERLHRLPKYLLIESLLAEMEAQRVGREHWQDSTKTLARLSLTGLGQTYGVPTESAHMEDVNMQLPPAPVSVLAQPQGALLWQDIHRYLQQEAHLHHQMKLLVNIGHAAGWIAHPSDEPLQNAWHVANALAIMSELPKLVDPDESRSQYQIERDVVTVTRWVMTDQMDAVKSRIRGLQEKALKLSLTPPELTVTGRQKMVDLPVVLSNGETDPRRVVSVLKSEIVLSGEVPRINGFRFLAKVEHERQMDGSYKNLVFAPSPDADERLARTDKSGSVHVCTPNCDHCGQTRQRKTTFIIEGESGTKQVGSSCVDDYIGQGTLSKIMAGFDIQMFLVRDDEWLGLDRDYMQSCREPTWWSITQYLALANNLTKTRGFVKSDAPLSTRDLCLEAILRPSKTSPELRQIMQLNDQQLLERHPELGAMIDFYRQIDSNSNYIQNLKVLMGREYLNLTHRFSTGLLASAPSAYYRATSEGVKLNEPFGQAKERGPLKLRIYNVKDNSHREHPSVNYLMTDDAGRSFSWSTAYPGNALMAIGATVVLNATIKEHALYEGRYTTRITRCDQIEVVEPNTPPPDFYAGASKRVVKESYKFSLLHTDDADRIDGDSHLHIHRSWKEDGKIRTFQDCLPVPLDYDWEQALLSRMSINGTSRQMPDGRYDWDPKIDKAFKSAIHEACRPYLPANLAFPATMYAVDDAFSPLLSPSPQQWGDPNASSDELFKKSPKLFVLRSDADQHGHQLVFGRLNVLKSAQWRPTIVPSTFRLSSLQEQQKFLACAEKRGKNLLVTVSEHGMISRLEPVGWHPSQLGSHLEIMGTEAIHRPLVDAHEKRSSRHLAGKKFVSISGLTSNPAAGRLLRSALDAAIKSVSPTLKLDWMAPTDPGLGGCPHLASLRYLCSDDFLLRAGDTRQVVLVDESTQYYLRALGADVVSIGVGDPRPTDDILLDAPRVPMVWESDSARLAIALSAAAESLVTQTNEVLADPSRDQQRVRRDVWRHPSSA